MAAAAADAVVAANTSSNARSTALTPPSRVFSTTLPVNPSATTTSTSAVMMSRPSTLPTKRSPGVETSSSWVSFTSALPFDDSSPIDKRPTLGSTTPKRVWA